MAAKLLPLALAATAALAAPSLSRTASAARVAAAPQPAWPTFSQAGVAAKTKGRVPRGVQTRSTPVVDYNRKFWVGGNWKCNGDKKAISNLITGLNEGPQIDPDIEVVCAPPIVYMDKARNELRDDFQVAAQNVGLRGTGAFTGESSASMVKDAGGQWAILGHSERRHSSAIDESDKEVAMKVKQCIDNNIKVVLCVGETLDQRKEGKTFSVVTRQLLAVAMQVSPKYWADNIVIAYEPVWAIGTGKVASAEQAQEVHEHIRNWMTNALGPRTSQYVRVVYGGSVNINTARSLSKEQDIDGFLVGGASLDAQTFLRIINSKNEPKVELDKKAVARYVLATGAQFGIITTVLYAIQKAFDFYNQPVPILLVLGLFGFLSVRSRVFSLMDNSRPKPSNVDPAFSQRLMPKWTPPPVAFPVIWSLIAVLRTMASVTAFEFAGGRLLNPALLAMLAHLSIGDTWNTINNVERRMGTAVVGVLAVLASVVAVEFAFMKTSTLAGVLLAPSVVWIGIAAALVTQIYRINNPKDGTEPLWPVQGRASAELKLPFMKYLDRLRLKTPQRA